MSGMEDNGEPGIPESHHESREIFVVAFCAKSRNGRRDYMLTKQKFDISVKKNFIAKLGVG
jgi:hypothetical protein